MTRRMDRVRIETAAGAFDAFERIELVQSLTDVSAVSILLGDDSSWRDLEAIVAPGKQVKVYCNDRIQFTGRAEINEVPVDSASGTQVQLVCRTKMADARYASADPATRFQGVSIKEFILALYAPLGYVESDFRFAPEADRNLMTGKAVGALKPVDLEPIKVDQAKVSPGETIFDAAEKHLKRHHMKHWDGALGHILVGKPAVDQAPLTRFLCRRGSAAKGNNVAGAKRVRDWSELVSELWVYGSSPGRDVTKASIKGVAVDLDVFAVAADSGHFNRKGLIAAEGAKTQAMADAQAKRELSARSQRKDAWEIQVDGWSYWNGQESIPFATNTTADVDIDTVGGAASGRYLIATLSRTLDASAGPSSSIGLVHPDALEL